jgi:hypothetical protein
MESITLEARTASDGTPYTRASTTIKIKEHTLISIEVNLPTIPGSQPIGEAAARVLDLAIEELEKERDNLRRNAAQSDQPQR